VRYPQEYRNSPEQLSLLPIVTAAGLRITLGDVARVFIEDGPPGIKSENARINGWTYVDIENVDVGSYVKKAREVVARELVLPTGYSITWSGQYEYMERAKDKLSYVIPMTLLLIVVLLYLNFRQFTPVVILMGSLPLALVGSLWLMYALGYNFSIAVGVGVIALAGVAVETGVLMLVYLEQAWQQLLRVERQPSAAQLTDAILHGAVSRVRPVLMTAVATIVGLLPILFGSGTGSEVMSRLAAPMVGGMLSSVALTLLVLPVIVLLWKKTQLKSRQTHAVQVPK
jgi:Cu(I)/Ag(I) efflux system membrane protein CusA/SilA